MSTNYKSLGIIGGAGPLAGAALYTEIIRYFQEYHGAINDNDFPKITLLSYPFSDMLKASDVNKIAVQNELQDAVKTLFKIDCFAFGIACNTLHLFTKNIDNAGMKFISIVDATKKAVTTLHSKKPLFLGSTTSVNNGLYNDLSEYVVYPRQDQQKVVMDIIFNVLSGAIYEDDALRLKSIVQEIFIETPFDSIILGCTELPLLHKKYPFLTDGGIPVIDTLAVLARELAHISIDF